MTAHHFRAGCTCPPVKDIVLASLAGDAESECPIHRPHPREAVPNIALNDDDALARRAGAQARVVDL